MLINNTYFEEAKSWYQERFELQQLKAKRWFAAFLIMATIALLALIADITLLPLKTLVPMIIHANPTTGETWVEKPDDKTYVPETEAQVQADVVRYITHRESYMAADINQRYHLVLLLSAPVVGKQYSEEQANSNEQSPINVLKQDGRRTVSIEDVVFIDKSGLDEKRHFDKPTQNIAKVDYITTTEDENHRLKTDYWVATISWEYHGRPATQQAAWDNWNGFQVTGYRTDLRNITSKNSH